MKIMIAEALDISRETYFAILLDRAFDGAVMIGSPIGGVDIEEVFFLIRRFQISKFSTQNLIFWLKNV